MPRASQRLGVWILLLVAVLAAGVYANSVPNGFVLDDVGVIENNPAVTEHDWLGIWASNYWPSREGPPDVLYRPLTIFSYVLQYALSPEHTWPFHAVNVALHTFISVMVTVLAWRLFRRRAVALMAGVLFAVHPIHTEVVANVVGRAELLAAFWSLAALLVFLPETALTEGPPARRSWWHGLLVAACMFWAVMSKETPAALLLGFPFLDYWRWSAWPSPKPTRWQWLWRQAVRYYLPLGVAMGIYLTMRIGLVGLMMNNSAVHPVVNPLMVATVLERVFTPFLLLAKYICLMFDPRVLSADYSAPSIMPTANPLSPLVLIGLLLVVTGIVAVVAYWRRHPQVACVLVLLALSYLLVANVIRIGTIFGERLFYWPSVFVVLLLAYAGVQGWQVLQAYRFRRVLRAGLATAGVAAVVLLSVRTWTRNPDWSSNLQMALTTGANNPRSAKACLWAGTVIINDTRERWTLDFGEQLLKRSTELYPSMGDSYWELAKYYAREQKHDQALINLAYAALHDGGRTDIRLSLRAVAGDLKRWPAASFLPAAEAHVKAAPQQPAAHLAYALALRSQDRYDQAEAEFKRALALEPCFDEAGVELGMLHLLRGNTAEAVYFLRHYVQRMRYNVEARCELVYALLQLDPHAYPDALREADMNLTRAAQLSSGTDPQVRLLRAEWAKKCAASERRADMVAPSGIGEASVAKGGS